MTGVSEKETSEALEWSIRHWEDNVERAKRGQEPLLGVRDCGLCRLFHQKSAERFFMGCPGCPVREATGQDYCRGTPYYDVLEATGPALLTHCRAELEFLKTLRKEEPTT